MLLATTQLDAVNYILASIGETPVNSIVDTDNTDVANIISILDNSSKEIQSRGYDFNLFPDLKLTPDVNGNILYNPTWLQIKPVDSDVLVSKRGNYLYDMNNATDIWTKPIHVSVIQAVEFEDLPHVFKDYITAHAAVKYQEFYVGDENVTKTLSYMEQEKYAAVKQYECRNATMFDNPFIMGKLYRG